MNLQEGMLTGWRLTNSPADPHLTGHVLSCARGQSHFVLTRQQLLELGQACLEAASSTPKPS